MDDGLGTVAETGAFGDGSVDGLGGVSAGRGPGEGLDARRAAAAAAAEAAGRETTPVAETDPERDVADVDPVRERDSLGDSVPRNAEEAWEECEALLPIESERLRVPGGFSSVVETLARAGCFRAVV